MISFKYPKDGPKNGHEVGTYWVKPKILIKHRIYEVKLFNSQFGESPLITLQLYKIKDQFLLFQKSRCEIHTKSFGSRWTHFRETLYFKDPRIRTFVPDLIFSKFSGFLKTFVIKITYRQFVVI